MFRNFLSRMLHDRTRLENRIAATRFGKWMRRKDRILDLNETLNVKLRSDQIKLFKRFYSVAVPLLVGNIWEIEDTGITFKSLKCIIIVFYYRLSIFFLDKQDRTKCFILHDAVCNVIRVTIIIGFLEVELKFSFLGNEKLKNAFADSNGNTEI